MTEIIAEDFKLTASIHEHVDRAIDEIHSHVPQTLSCHVYLAKVAPKKFSAKMKTQYMKKGFFAESEDDNLYRAIDQAKDHLRKQLDRAHDRTVSQKKS